MDDLSSSFACSPDASELFLPGQSRRGVVVLDAAGDLIFADESARLLMSAPGESDLALAELQEAWRRVAVGVVTGSMGWQVVVGPTGATPLEARWRGEGPPGAGLAVWELRSVDQGGTKRFLEIIAGATAGEVGETFCRALARQIGPVLGCRRLVVARLVDATAYVCRSVVVWTDGELRAGREFVAEDNTGSRLVLERGFFETWGDLPERFPGWAARLPDAHLASVVSVALQSAQGKRIGFISAFFDRGTERRPEAGLWLRLFATRVAAELQREDAARAHGRSERRLRELLDALPAGVVLLDDTGVSFANPMALRQLGVSGHDGLTPGLTDEGITAMQDQLRRAGREAMGGTRRARLRRADGAEFEAEVSASTVMRGERELTQVLINDVTFERRISDAVETVTRATSRLAGEPFFTGFARELGLLLEARRVVIVRYLGPRNDRGRYLAVWEGGRLIEEPEFEIRPEMLGAAIRDEGEIEIWHDLPERFPRYAGIYEQRGVRSVVARRLVGQAGEAIGHLSVAFAPEAERQPHIAPVLKLFAARAAAELERLDAQAVLRASEHQKREVLDRLNTGVLVAAERVVSYANPEALRLLGCAAGDGANGVVGCALPEETWRALEQVMHAAADGGTVTCTVPLWRCDGGRFDAELFCERWGEDAGAGWQIVLRDVTTHRRYVEAIETVSHATGGLVGLAFLESFVRELGRLLSARRVVIIQFLEGGHDRARHVAAWNEGEQVPLTDFDVLADGVTRAILEQGRMEVWGGLAQRFPSSRDWHHRRGVHSILGCSVCSPGGEVLGHLSASFGPETPRQDHAMPIVELFAARIGAEMDRMKQEAVNRRLAAQLETAQRLEALGRLAGGVAHDFNNVLTSIMGNVEMALLDLAADHPLRGMLQDAMGGARRARDVVAQLLTFSQRRASQARATAVVPVVEEACRLMQATLPPGVQVEFTAAPELPPVRCDATQIHQVVMNLCTNAVQASQERGGVVRVSMTEGRMRRDGEDAAAVIITVSDGGEGMSDEVKERLFEPFFTTKRNGQGTGLGLATVHGIVGSVEGVIEVDSALGEGTTFRIRLPACAEEEPPPLPPPVSPRSDRQRLVVVDDEPAVLRTLCRMLAGLGYEAEPFTDPTRAVAVLDEDAGIVGLLTDYAMPALNGVDLISRVKKTRPALPCWLVSGNASAEVVAAAREAGAEACLEKPLGLAKLEAELGQVFKGA